MRVAVDPAALGEWSAAARGTSTRLSTALGDLGSALTPLAAGWDGAAATGFDQHYARWQEAAAGIVGTLSQLVVLVDTAEANYRAAIAANQQIWTGGSGSAVVVSVAGVGGALPVKIDAEMDDVRATVTSLVGAGDALATAWEKLGAALARTVAMAGDDPTGAAFGRDHDAMAAAAWQGWRHATVLVDAIAGGLAETGNNNLGADKSSQPGGGTPERITARARPIPAPPPPPGSVGNNGSRAYVPPLDWYWPTADPTGLRAAGAAWQSSSSGLRDLAGRARGAVDGLVNFNPDPALEQMRTFTRSVLSEDPNHGTIGLLTDAGRRITSACNALADLTDETRARMRDTIFGILGGDEWYRPVATVLDLLITRGWAKWVAAGGDAAMLDLRLSEIHDDHARGVQLIRAEISPAASDHLARLVTAIVPPKPVTADSCIVTSPAGTSGAAMPEAERQALIAELVAKGTKVNAAEVLHIARAPDGRIIWIERGGETAGLSHILRAERIGNFLNKGISPTEIPGLAIRAVTDGTPLGGVGKSGIAYDVEMGDGRHESIVVIVGSNGFIVSAYPMDSKTTLKPLR